MKFNTTKRKPALISPKTQLSLIQAPPLELYEYYSHEAEIDDSRYRVYKPVAKQFLIDVDSDDRVGKIHMVFRDSRIVRVTLSEQFKRESGRWFVDKIAAVIPPHIALRAQNTSVLKLPEGDAGKRVRRGRSTTHGYTVLLDGWCEGTHLHRAGVKQDPRIHCTTRYKGGFTFDALQVFGTAVTPTKITMGVTVSGRCHHHRYKDYG